MSELRFSQELFPRLSCRILTPIVLGVKYLNFIAYTSLFTQSLQNILHSGTALRSDCIFFWFPQLLSTSAGIVRKEQPAVFRRPRSSSFFVYFCFLSICMSWEKFRAQSKLFARDLCVRRSKRSRYTHMDRQTDRQTDCSVKPIK